MGTSPVAASGPSMRQPSSGDCPWPWCLPRSWRLGELQAGLLVLAAVNTLGAATMAAALRRAGHQLWRPAH